MKKHNKWRCKMTEICRDAEFVPTLGTEGKPFQVDEYGNHRIVMKGKESTWHKPQELATLKVVNEDGTVDIFIAVNDMHVGGSLPTGCVLKTATVDEDGDVGYYKFKFIDLVTDEILDTDGVFDALSESTFERDYDIKVKMSTSGRADFVKIKITAIDAMGREDLDRVLNRDDVVDYLVNALDKYEFDIYDELYEVINLPDENRCGCER